MSIRKQFLKHKPICKVTFRIPEETGRIYETAHLVGEFNNWDLVGTPMKKLKTGAFTATIGLIKGEKYQFRYLLDGKNWANDRDADEFNPTPYGNSENSAIIL